MESVELEESIEMRCTLYGQFAYEDEYETRPVVMALSNDDRWKQRERDKEDFLEWLWLSPLAGGLAGDVGRDELNRLRQFAKANGLVRGRDPHYSDLEELIKEAVEDDLIVPVIDRTVQFGSGYMAPASASPPSFSGGLLGGASSAAMPSLSGALSGEPLLSGPYDPATQGARVMAARASASDGAGAAGGQSSPDVLAKSFGDDSVSGSLLGDAQPFEYVPDDLSGEVLELAGADGRPGNNQAQNKQTNDVARILQLTPDQAQQLHYELGSEPPMGFHEIMERAKDMFNLW